MQAIALGSRKFAQDAQEISTSLLPPVPQDGSSRNQVMRERFASALTISNELLLPDSQARDRRVRGNAHAKAFQQGTGLR
jgi:hypothetical protein